MRKIHKIILNLEELYNIIYKHVYKDEFQEADRLIREIKDELRNTALVPLNLIKDNIKLERSDNEQSEELVDNVATFSVSADMITQKSIEQHIDPEEVISLIKNELFHEIVYLLTDDEED